MDSFVDFPDVPALASAFENNELTSLLLEVAGISDDGVPPCGDGWCVGVVAELVVADDGAPIKSLNKSFEELEEAGVGSSETWFQGHVN